jgi:hypothetical protein
MSLYDFKSLNSPAINVLYAIYPSVVLKVIKKYKFLLNKLSIKKKKSLILFYMNNIFLKKKKVHIKKNPIWFNNNNLIGHYLNFINIKNNKVVSDKFYRVWNFIRLQFKLKIHNSPILNPIKQLKLRNYFKIKSKKYKKKSRKGKQKQLKKIISTNILKFILEKMISKLFGYDLYIKIRCEPLKFKKILEEESITVYRKYSNKTPNKLISYQSNNWIVLPKFLLNNIININEDAWNNKKFRYLENWRLRNLENIFVAIINFKNIQLLADLLISKLLNKKEHKRIFYFIADRLNDIIRTGLCKNLIMFRLALIGRINNISRTRTMYFSSIKKRKPKRNTFNRQINFAESRVTAPIGAFHIKLWFEYTE